MRPLTLQRLEIFRAVYEEKSVSAAAKRLRLTQPTVSRHLRDFEAATGLELFSLTLGRLVPTPEADLLYGECVFLSEGAARIEASIEALRRGETQPLSVMSVSLFVNDILPSALQATLLRLPALSLKVDIGLAAQQIRALRNGVADVGLVAGDIPEETGLKRQTVGRGRFVCILPREHPLAGAEFVSLEALRTTGIAINIPRGPLGRILLDRMEALNVPVGTTITAASLQLLPALAARMRACVVVDTFTAETFPHASTRIVPLAPDLSFGIYAVTLQSGGLGTAARTFIECLQERLAAQEP